MCNVNPFLNNTKVPPPSISVAEPSILCIFDADQIVKLIGSGFLRIDGVYPLITMDGVPLQVLGASNCNNVTEVVHGTLLFIIITSLWFLINSLLAMRLL